MFISKSYQTMKPDMDGIGNWSFWDSLLITKPYSGEMYCMSSWLPVLKNEIINIDV